MTNTNTNTNNSNNTKTVVYFQNVICNGCGRTCTLTSNEGEWSPRRCGCTDSGKPEHWQGYNRILRGSIAIHVNPNGVPVSADLHRTDDGEVNQFFKGIELSTFDGCLESAVWKGTPLCTEEMAWILNHHNGGYCYVGPEHDSGVPTGRCDLPPRPYTQPDWCNS